MSVVAAPLSTCECASCSEFYSLSINMNTGIAAAGAN